MQAQIYTFLISALLGDEWLASRPDHYATGQGDPLRTASVHKTGESRMVVQCGKGVKMSRVRDKRPPILKIWQFNSLQFLCAGMLSQQQSGQ
jgi:hypothetical protein